MSQYVIDRFEDGPWAVLEAGERTLTVPREWL